jgi:hypothetical protein
VDYCKFLRRLCIFGVSSVHVLKEERCIILIIIIITDQDSDHGIGIGDKQIEQNQATFLDDNNISGTESGSNFGSSSYFKVLGKSETEKS